MKTSLANIESLAKAGKELMLKEPFYGLLLLSLNKVWNENIKDQQGNPTAGVSLNRINYQLSIHPEFWEALSPIQKMGILKHELLHIGFFHLTDFTSYPDSEQPLLNVAMDIEINQYIDRSWLPEHGCFLENFPELNMEERKGTRYYYEKLKEKQTTGDPTVQALLALLASGGGSTTLPNGQQITTPSHDWGEFKQLDSTTKKLLEQQTKHIISQIADQVEKSQGTIPGEFAGILERIREVIPPKFDWKGYIRRFAGKSTQIYTKKSRRKYNKRLPDFPGLKIKQQKHILAGIDTSGSVSNKELKEFLNELYHLKKTGSEVTIIEADSAIAYIGKFDIRRDLEIHGRGGTDFQPVIDYYRENTHKYSCLIYFTDGECSAPEGAQGNILWVLSSQSSMNTALPGSVIKLDI